MAYHRSIAVSMALAALSTFSDFGLAKVGPQPIRRGQLDLSQPMIPPARPKATADEKAAIRDRMRLAAIKRERKAEKLGRLVASGAMLPV